MLFTDYLIPTCDGNLLALTEGEEGTSRCDSLADISSSEALERRASPNPRETWIPIPGAIMRVHHETGRILFDGKPAYPHVRITFERLDMNRQSVSDEYYQRHRQ